MNVIRKPCSPKNFMPGRPGGLRPAAIVIHISEGTLASADAWFNNDAALVSAHYMRWAQRRSASVCQRGRHRLSRG